MVIIGIVVLLLIMPLLRGLFWWLFSFEERVQDLMFQKKSSEVRLGKITESLAPLLSNFPVDTNKVGTSTVFIGQPIDYIHFDPDEGITFIEVKSGGAKLSSQQRKLKSLVEEGKVRWVNFSIKGE